MSTNGTHDIEWMPVPASHFNLAAGESFTVPACERGFCWSCDERFTR